MSVSFNKRTHASTLYKAIAAKQRLQELELMSAHRPNEPVKKQRLGEDGRYKLQPGVNTCTSSAQQFGEK